MEQEQEHETSDRYIIFCRKGSIQERARYGGKYHWGGGRENIHFIFVESGHIIVVHPQSLEGRKCVEERAGE